MTSDAHTDLSKAVYVLTNAQRICILTGAGISAESGIPTFRDKQTGLWENFRAEDLANCDSFVRDPELVWSWYQWRRSEVKDKRPNPAHEALATWQAQTEQLGQTISLITQNVDDLHEQAGSQATHLHGELWQNHCSECGQTYEEAIDPAVTALVSCKSCGGKVRPSIVWFGEMLPQEPWQIAQQAAEDCEVFISIGTSSMVYPAAGLAQSAKQNGATVIEINPQPTDNGLVDIQLPYPAGEILPELVAQLSQAKN
jgi:NAD-dependent deacetylase